MIDGTIIRAHRHAAGARNGQEKQGLGRVVLQKISIWQQKSS